METLLTVIKSLAKRGESVAITTQTAEVCKISVAKNGVSVSTMAVMTERKLSKSIAELSERLKAEKVDNMSPGVADNVLDDIKNNL